MIIDLDTSFLRLRDNFQDALDLSESPAVELQYTDQIHLIPSETYFQISNSPTNVVLGTYEVYLVDQCNNQLEEVTVNVYVSEFIDSNGINQISFEFFNDFDYSMRPVSLKFVNTGNNNTWWTNLFVTSDYNKHLTTRFDYKSNGYHEGTQYDRANFYQSIRLSNYYNNPINESERQEYHQISTNVTVSARNIKKIKRRFILDNFNDFTVMRLETLVTNTEVYVDTVRHYSTTPIEFVPREADSNISEQELILNPDYTQIFTFDFQIFPGVLITALDPLGNYNTGTMFSEFTADFNVGITLNTGTVRVYVGMTLIGTFDQDEMTIVGGNQLVVDLSSNPTIENPANESHYILMDAGLVSALGVPFEGITDSSVWFYILSDGDFNSADFNSSDYFTN